MKKLLSFTDVLAVDVDTLDTSFTGKDAVFNNLADTFWNEYVPAKINRYMETGAVQQLNHIITTSTAMHKKTDVLSMLRSLACHSLQKTGKLGGKMDKSRKLKAMKMVEHNSRKVPQWYKSYALYIAREAAKSTIAGKASKKVESVLCKDAARLVARFKGESLIDIVTAITIAYNASHEVKVTGKKTPLAAAMSGSKGKASTRGTTSRAVKSTRKAA